MHASRLTAMAGCDRSGLMMPWAGKREVSMSLYFGPVPKRRYAIGRILARRLIREQQLHDHAARLDGTLGRRLHHHVGRGLADAGGGEHALTFDLDHAGATIAVGAIAGSGQPAQMRNVDAFALSHLPDGFAGPGRHHFPSRVNSNWSRHRFHFTYSSPATSVPSRSL